MNGDDFRSLALSMPEATESAHMGHPDFRVRRKIFATLATDEESAVVKLTLEQQALFVRSEPDVYEPVKGGWGRRGYTRIELAAASEPSARQALILAWRNTAPERLSRQFDE